MKYLNELIVALSSKMGNAFPKILGAILLLIIGLFLARVMRNIVKRLLSKTNMDEKLGQKLKIKFRIDQFVAKMVYYLVVIYTLLIVLGMMGLESVLAPMENMMGEFLSFLPNLIGAGIIGFAGYILSKIVSEATGFLSNTLEPYAVKAGFEKPESLTNLLKSVVFALVFLPILIVAVDTLKLKAISEPATAMLGTVLNAIPKILAASIIIGAFYIIGKFVVGLLIDLLKNVGVDEFSQKMGFDTLIGNQSMTNIIGKVAFFFLLFTGVITGTEQLGMTSLNDILANLYQISGQILFGIIILAVGAYMSNLVGNMVTKSESSWMAPIAKFAVIGIFLAFALHTMGIAESIVNLAFGLTLGAAATAFALAFGLGGREVAGRQLERFFDEKGAANIKQMNQNGKVSNKVAN